MIASSRSLDDTKARRNVVRSRRLVFQLSQLACEFSRRENRVAVCFVRCLRSPNRYIPVQFEGEGGRGEDEKGSTRVRSRSDEKNARY